MTDSIDNNAFEGVVQRVNPGSNLLRAWALTGGVSAEVTALEVLLPDGQTQKMIVRRHGVVDLGLNPNIAADEFALLRFLKAVGLAAPESFYLDSSGEIFPTPYLVVEFVEGTPDFAPSNLADFIRQMASALAQIHVLDGLNPALAFLPQQTLILTEKLKQRPTNLDDSLDEGPIRDALEAACPPTATNNIALLHGDFWPGNILWKDGQIAAVIDWEDALLGDPLADLANARLEVLWAFGVEARMRKRHQGFIAQAFEKLAL